MNKNSLYHMGIKEVKRSTLAYANENRSHEIYQDLFYSLLDKLHGNRKKHKFRFKNPLYSIDASTIDLCLNLFTWAKFRKNKGGIKLHVKLDHSGYVPSFVSVTDAKVHEMNEIRDMPLKKGDVIVFDRGYTDYKQYSTYCEEGIYFVTRLKRNASFNILKEAETEQTIVLLTNHHGWSPETIAAIYKDRWQIEVFFKTIKQNMKIKSFFGTSRNAVLTQIWIVMISFLLLKYLADSSTQSWSVGYLMGIIPILLFMKRDIWLWLNKPKLKPDLKNYSAPQMELFL